jgi:hypothetical protein
MSIPNGITSVAGNGNTDVVDFSPSYGYSWNYGIVRNGDGSISVTDNHGGSITNVLMTGVAGLNFADAYYDVASGNLINHVALVSPGTTSKIIDNGTTMVIGNGSANTVDFSATSNGRSWNFAISRNADGSVSVTDTASGTISNTKMMNISSLKFADGTYDVASGNFTQDNSHIVNFTSGTNTVAAPTGTIAVNGNGSIDTLDLSSLYCYSSNFTITKNADGTFSMTDNHGGNFTKTRLSGISEIKFADGTYDLPSGNVASSVFNFAAGNNTATPPLGTQLVVGNGAVDIVDLSGVGIYSTGLTIIRNADGSVTATDPHGYLNSTRMVGIATIRLADGTVNTQTGQFTANTGTFVFAPGQTIAAVPAHNILIEGNGLTDTVDLSSQYAYSWNFSITHNADGTSSMTDNHGGTFSNAKLYGIASIKFTDGTYDLATGHLTANTTTSTTTTTTTTTTTSSGPTVTFAPGVDTLNVASGTGALVGNGDPDTAVFANQHGWYSITRNSNSSLTVSDIHTGSVNHMNVSGINTLKFSDGWTYNASNGQYDAITQTGLQPGQTLHAPTFTSNGDPNAVVGIKLQNPTGATTGAHTVTFGEAFATGDLPTGSGLVANIGGNLIPVQIDVKTTHADGSVATAVLTFQAPALAGNANTDVMLTKAASPISGPALDAHDFVANGYDTDISLNFHNSDGTTTALNIDAGAALIQALAAGTTKTWLSGPLATEVQVNVPINGSLHAVLNIRGNADGTFATDVQMLNDGIYSQDGKSYNYDVTLSSHGQTSYTESGVNQTVMQAWHKVVNSDAHGTTQAIPDYIAQNVNYLEKAGMIASYDTSTGVSSDSLLNQYVQATNSNTGLLSSAQVTTYEPGTGGRPDIGPTTQWAAQYLTVQNSVAANIMLTNADAAGASPFHALNPDGSLVNATNNPNLWLDSRGSGPVNNFGTVESQSGWTLDPAHIPDLSYIPALTTGSQYYLTQVQEQANYDIMAINPAYRGGSAGVIVDNAQVRATAWTIRDLTNAAVLTPDGDPAKAYFTGILENNINQILNEYVNGPAGAAEGDLHGYILGVGSGGQTPQTAPWQQGYLAISMAQAAKAGFAGAAQVCAWENNFITGLFLNGNNGYNPYNGPAYWLTVGTANSGGGYTPYTTWSQLYSANFGTNQPTSMGGVTDAGGGYPAILKAAVAELWDVTHSADDLAVYAYITQNTPTLITSSSGYAANQDWNINPTLSDGHKLLNSEVFYGNGGTINALTSHSLLAASTGNNILNAGSANSILIGGTGTDTLNGGNGDDFIFAGNGTQSLYGGSGTNYIKGGMGTDTFLMHSDDAAHDTIVGFKNGIDVISIATGGSGSTAASLIASVTADNNGNAVLHLSGQHDVTLVGLHTSDLNTNMFLIA